jgi:hypothetical protein
MTTTLERLVQLSGLSGSSAGQHLKQIAGAAGIAAGALLVTYSGLSSATAAQHLLTDHGGTSQNAGANVGDRPDTDTRRHDQLQTTYRLAADTTRPDSAPGQRTAQLQSESRATGADTTRPTQTTFSRGPRSGSTRVTR